MRRREFILTLAGVAMLPNFSRAEQSGRVYRIGWLHPVQVPDSWLRGFREGLREFNYFEGKNLIIEYRWGDGDFDRLPAMAAELASLNLDLLISGNTAAVVALQKATRTIPIVMLGIGDPLGTGLIASLARPDGNITGMSVMGRDLSAKRLELLKEVVPKLTRVAVLSNPGNPAVVLGLQDTRAAAQALGLAIDSMDVRQPAELDQALSLLIKSQPGALILLSDSMVHNERAQIAAFAIEHRLPSISPFREFAQAGGLMAYGPNLGDVYRRAVGFIDKILRGFKPADLPIQQPTKFELVINIKTAKALGLDVPLHLQQLANEVIE